MPTWRRSTALTVMAALLAASSPAVAQLRVEGALARKNFFGQTVLPEEFQVVHGSEFKGAHRVAISVFDVAFPDENHFKAQSVKTDSMFSHSSTAKMKTTLAGVDQATRQRITDKAYALFIDQLSSAGYEVVGQEELARLAPEFGRWPSVPNFSPGRFGTYVAPTGQSLRFLQGDTAKRDTSGFLGQQLTVYRGFDRPIAFDRSPYIARDGKVGVLAVTLVVDYGAYSSSGQQRSFGKAKASFSPGVTIAGGDAIDHGTLLEYWGPRSGGFPAVAFLQRPIRSDQAFGAVEGVENSGEYTLRADPAKFEVAADEAAGRAVAKLVEVMVAAK